MGTHAEAEKDHAPAVLDAILQRSSVTRLLPEPPPRELIERLLSAAVLAPNHYLNQPWRFVVVTGSAREDLGAVMAEHTRRGEANPDSPEAQGRQAAERSRLLRAPVLIFVACADDGHAQAVEVENIAATAAAAEHVLLAAPDLGLGVFWRTGAAAYAPDVKRFLGLQPEDRIIAILYVGYPAVSGTPQPRASAADKTTWLGG